MKLVKFTSALLCAYASAATIFADGFTHQASDESSTWSEPSVGFAALLLLATLVGIAAIGVFAAKDRRRNREKSGAKDRPMAE